MGVEPEPWRHLGKTFWAERVCMCLQKSKDVRAQTWVSQARSRGRRRAVARAWGPRGPGRMWALVLHVVGRREEDATGLGKETLQATGLPRLQRPCGQVSCLW